MSTKPKPSGVVPVRLNEALLKRIQEVAQQIGESQSTVMRIAMRIGLERIETSLAPGESFNLTREMVNEARASEPYKLTPQAMALNDNPPTPQKPKTPRNRGRLRGYDEGEEPGAASSGSKKS